jgi:LacI family transcriptional regulator
LDNWRVGRTAGWAITGLSKRQGPVGILVGNHRYRCQELNETGFRSYCREHAPGFSLLEPLQTFEDNNVAREITEQLLRREPDLAGLYVCGGGMKGVLQALETFGKGSELIVVGHEITDHTRVGVMDNLLSMVFAHPIKRLAAEAISQMNKDLSEEKAPAKRILNFEIYGPENI